MLNLHHIVRKAITMNYADQEFQLYRSIGQGFDKGIKVARYAAPVTVSGNFQSEGDAALDHADMAGQNSIIRKLYLYAEADKGTRPWANYRPLARSGDYIVDHFGGYWYVSAVTEDFSDAGWVCLRVTFQQTPVSLNVDEQS